MNASDYNKLNEVFSLKDRALQFANGDLEKAKAIFAWYTESVLGSAGVDKDPPAAPAPKATKPKAEKPAEPAKEPAKAEQKSYEIGSGEPIQGEEVKAPAKLSYDTDVLPEILATLNRLTTAGHSTDDGKAAIVNMMSSTFGVKNAKDVKPERWAELVATLKQLGA